ncbi:MAG: ABC transporter substrate-binding protein [Epulopiscium sp.]|nr:ABC transporter substrate-binding protein [Candidatus Epulonipiscium sp.]
MKLKRIVALLLISILMITTLAACTDKAEKKDDKGKTEKTETSTNTSTSSTTDASSSDKSTTEESSKYDVTQPITIEWWHALESQYQPTLDKVVADFESKNPNIKVEAIYQGSYSDLNEKLVAAQAAGTTLPAVTVANSPLIAEYGASGLCEILDPYIEATGFDIDDFGEGLVRSSSYDGQQVSLPFQISTQIMYYNKDMATAEGITIPTKWSEMDEFITKVAKVSGGTTERYATVIPGWDQWYFETFFLNNGVNIVNDDNVSTDLNSEKALSIAESIKKWHQDGTAYLAYGTGASADMRQNFLDGKAFSVIHTSSLYNMYVDNATFEVGMAWLPGGDTDYSEVGGNMLLIPAKNTQEVKNAGWALLTYLTSKDVNMVWAIETGYMPTRNSVTQTEEAKEFLKVKPAFDVIFDNLDKINPRIQHPAYTRLSSIWKEHLAKAVIENEDMKTSMDAAKKLIDEALEEE